MIEKKMFVICDYCKARVDLSHRDAIKWLRLSLGTLRSGHDLTLLTRDFVEGPQWVSIPCPVLVSPPYDGGVYTQEFCCLACARAWFGGATKEKS